MKKTDLEKLVFEILEELQKEMIAYNTSKGNMTGYDCVICQNRGFFMEISQGSISPYQKYVPCECQKIRQSINNMQQSGLSDILKEKTFDNFNANEQWLIDLKNKAMKYANDPQGSWFYVGGMTGAGKTHICSAIYMSLIRKGLSPKYFRWREGIIPIKAAVNDWEIYNELIGKLKNCELLYIDDLFWTGHNQEGRNSMPTQADMNLAFEVIDYRYLNKNKITIISSEFDMNELYKIDPSIAGRIKERCGENVVSIKKDPKRNYRIQNHTARTAGKQGDE